MDEDFLDVTTSTSKLTYFFVILVFIVIAGLGYYFIFVRNNFTLRERTVEAGEKLNTKVSYYVRGKGINSNKVKLNLSKVNTNKVGKYKYTASYYGKVKTSYISVEDTKAPVFKTKELSVEEGDTSFYLGDFLTKCDDASKPCLVNYKNKRDEDKVNKVGTYKITIVVSDVYNNEKTAKVTLNVVEPGTLEKSDTKYDEVTEESTEESSSDNQNSDDQEQIMDDFVEN